MSKPKQGSNIDIPDHILRQLLTPSESRMLKNRWQIIQYLKEGLSIRKVAQKVKVGTDTVIRASRMIEKENKQTGHFESQTPWIFGKK